MRVHEWAPLVSSPGVGPRQVIDIANNAGSKEVSRKERVSIVGPLCTPLDTLADKMELPKTEIGDLVIILQSGAYGKSASPENFLGHPAVKELLI